MIGKLGAVLPVPLKNGTGRTVPRFPFSSCPCHHRLRISLRIPKGAAAVCIEYVFVAFTVRMV